MAEVFCLTSRTEDEGTPGAGTGQDTKGLRKKDAGTSGQACSMLWLLCTYLAMDFGKVRAVCQWGRGFGLFVERLSAHVRRRHSDWHGSVYCTNVFDWIVIWGNMKYSVDFRMSQCCRGVLYRKGHWPQAPRFTQETASNFQMGSGGMDLVPTLLAMQIGLRSGAGCARAS